MILVNTLNGVMPLMFQRC